eukprot:3708746-Rhodomonas_salina.2
MMCRLPPSGSLPGPVTAELGPGVAGLPGPRPARAVTPAAAAPTGPRRFESCSGLFPNPSYLRTLSQT